MRFTACLYILRDYAKWITPNSSTTFAEKASDTYNISRCDGPAGSPPAGKGEKRKERKDIMNDTIMKYDCYDFDVEKAFGVSFVFASPDWERFLDSFTDDYVKYPPRIAPHPSLQRVGLYYFDKDVAVLVTPAGIYSYGAASLTLRGPAYRPLAKYFEIWGE